MTTDSWHISVVIPARNEEDLLASCLESVLEARAELSAATSFDLVVVVDSSTDRSHEIAAQIVKGHGVVLPIDAGNVGAVRTYGVERALHRCSKPRDHFWIANTDADCVVPRYWLVDQLRLAAQGIEAVAGIVDVDDFSDHSVHVKDRFRRTYLLNPDGSHPHVHGANLGVRADTYLRAGGWACLATAEDHDLWRRCAATGARTHSSSLLKVLTSGRRTGRAPHGFAEALAAHNETAA